MAVTRSFTYAALAALITAAHATVLAQSVRQIRLRPADAKLEEEFTVITSVRELSDGRVLITDPREARVVVADLASGLVTQVGRTGKGPGEYSMAAPIRPMAGDSSILFDLMTRRWLLLDGARIAVTLPPDAPIVLAMKGYALAADSRGFVWKIEAPPSRGGGQDGQNWKPGSYDYGATDSNYVVRGHRGSGKLDTLAKLRQPISRQTVRADANGKFQSVSYSRPPLAVGEEAAYFTDGWVAIARLDPYRVDWITPDGKVVKGAPIPLAPVKVTPREKDAYLERQRAANSVGPGARAAPPMPEALRADIAALRDQFPDVFPPFVSGLIAGDNGQLLLRRPQTADFPDYRYDVVDRRGRLLALVSLAARERILTVTRTAAYVVWKDQDDVERLRRHPWP